jgi:hypothetical protein
MVNAMVTQEPTTLNPVPSLQSTLAYGNLMEIFNERSERARLEAMKKYYADDIVFYEPQNMYQGHEEISKVAQGILDKNPDWGFQPITPIIANHNLIILAWGFGPPGDFKVKGEDILLLEAGKIKTLYVVIEGQSEVM